MRIFGLIAGLLLSNVAAASEMTEVEFNIAIERVEKVYAPVVEKLGRTLLIDRKWESESHVALAMQGYFITIPGGLARMDGMTPDALSLFVCHEVGHYLGGAPKYAHPNLKWSSVEGQADFFATSVCVREAFASDNNTRLMSTVSVPPLVRKRCEMTFASGEDASICMRSGLAALAAVLTLPLGNSASLSTPDNLVVPVLNESYPTTQCRLDTYMAGSLSQPAIESRPVCWFKPD